MMTNHLTTEEKTLFSEMMLFTTVAGEFTSELGLLDRLHDITCEACKLNVQGAFRLPEAWGDLRNVALNKNVFLHGSVPNGWWDAYFLASHDSPSPSYAMAQFALAPFTLTESMQSKDPIGEDRWAIELSHRYGMRDLLVCPVGGRWVFTFWSSDVLTQRLSLPMRSILNCGAMAVISRLEQLMVLRGDTQSAAKCKITLSAREEAVLRLMSSGKRTAEIAKQMGISPDTVRSHLKKTQSKLGARTLPQTMAQAIRHRLFP